MKGIIVNLFDNINTSVRYFCRLIGYNFPNKLCSRSATKCIPVCGKRKQGTPKTASMEALVFDKRNRSLQLRRDFPKPKIMKDDDVIMKVEWAGVCGTDVHIVQGEFAGGGKRPMPLGHESAGIIDAVGKSCVFKVGQKVAIDPNRLCRVCDFCRRGLYQLCLTDGLNSAVGIHRDGAWAEYLRIPQEQVYPLPKSVTTQQGALTEPISCVVHAFNRAAPLRIGQKILILGSGIIGNIMVCSLHHQGHRDVTVSEMMPSRLELIKKLETGFRLVSPETISKENILYDVIFDNTGVVKAMETSLKFMRQGGKYVIFGCAPPEQKAGVSTFDMFDKELNIIGVRLNPYCFGTAISWIEAMGTRYVNYEKLGVKTYKLSQYKTALKDLKSGKISKATFKFAKDSCSQISKRPENC